MKPNLLIGAISGNYSINDIRLWVETSDFENVERVLILYNNKENPQLQEYLKQNNIGVVFPTFDFFGQEKEVFETNTGKVTLDNSYELIHNIRFLHIATYASDTDHEKIFITDVKDVYFNSNPFDRTPGDKIIATGEVIRYSEDAWNTEHLQVNLGVAGMSILDKEVYNVGVFGGNAKLVIALCKDIYLMSVGKLKVADQTSFNYLINNSYKDVVVYTSIDDLFAVHLHVVAAGKVQFDLNSINKYTIVHQYDRL